METDACILTRGRTAKGQFRFTTFSFTGPILSPGEASVSQIASRGMIEHESHFSLPAGRCFRGALVGCNHSLRGSGPDSTFHQAGRCHVLIDGSPVGRFGKADVGDGQPRPPGSRRTPPRRVAGRNPSGGTRSWRRWRTPIPATWSIEGTLTILTHRARLL